jgi:hypothetical protein
MLVPSTDLAAHGDRSAWRRRWGALLVVFSLCVATIPVIETVVSPTPAAAASGWKLPWRAGDRWIVARGPIGHAPDPGMLGNGLYWDIAQVPGASPEVLAVADGTARIICGPDGIGQTAISLTTSDGTQAVYAHLSASAVLAAGITTAGKSVEQGDVLGQIYPSAGPFGGTCGSGSGQHLHFEISRQPLNIDGVTFTNTGPESGILTSTNGAKPDAPSGAQMATESDGTLWMSAIDEDGTLYTREGAPGSGWQPRLQQGAPESWVSADLAVDSSDHVWLVAVKDDGRAFARRYNRGWESWVEMGLGAWSTEAPPSITRRADGGITLALVKASGLLYTRNWTPASGWGSFVTQGVGDWAMADVATAGNGDLWLIAVKDDGRAYVRRGVVGAGWNAFSYQGGGFQTDAPPAITPRDGSGITWAMVTSGGTLYTRNWISGTWSAKSVHGSGGWATVDVTLTENGEVWLAAVKGSGQAYVRRGIPGSGWNPLSIQGSGGWSTKAPPSITPRDGSGITYSLLKSNGTLYTRNWTSGGWWDFVMHYSPGSWAALTGVQP